MWNKNSFLDVLQNKEEGCALCKYKIKVISFLMLVQMCKMVQ